MQLQSIFLTGLLVLLPCTQLMAQNSRESLEWQWFESHQKLRTSMINLRDIRAASCRSGDKMDCQLAQLGDVEIILLDIELRYRHADSEKGKRVKDHVGNARYEISDLINAINAIKANE